MAKITITEALAELKTIGKRIEKKREFVSQHAGRQLIARDPLEKDGGQRVVIQKERQSIVDLQNRALSLRIAINKKNLEIMVTVQGIERSMAEWIAWKREHSGGESNFLKLLFDRIEHFKRTAASKSGKVISDEEFDPKESTAGDCTINIDETTLLGDREFLELVLGDLDGKLSLVNATTLIDVE